MSELNFIKGLGQGQCYIKQRDDKYVVQDRFVLGGQDEYSFDDLMSAVLYAQENFRVITFSEPLIVKEPEHA